MAESATLPKLHDQAAGSARTATGASVSVRLAHHLEEVESAWRQLEGQGVESPGQSFDFIRLWIGTQAISEADQVYLVAELVGTPLALLALHRKRVRGVRQLAWFPGAHVGCNAPLVDRARLAAMSPDARRILWSDMLAKVQGIDVVYLKAMPAMLVEGTDIFAELGTSATAETLHRAQFGNWDEANTTQRSKSRRKHDRQQGERLEALGEVGFEEITSGPDAAAVLDLMFRQRAARFRTMGVADPFVCDVRAFYDATVAPGSAVDVRLHVLRLNGEVVAVRYNVALGDRLFCLISSMSDDPAIQTGSPGKQCLLRVMQTVFDRGYGVFDMGAGFTDEKRHWCNIQVPVRQHDIALTPQGRLATGLHRLWQISRKRIKEDERLLKLAKSVRARLQKSKPEAEDPSL